MSSVLSLYKYKYFLSSFSFLGGTIIKVILLIFNLKTLMDQKKYWQEMKYFARECEIFCLMELNNILFLLYLCIFVPDSFYLLFTFFILSRSRGAALLGSWKRDVLDCQLRNWWKLPIQKKIPKISRFQKIKEEDASDYWEAKKNHKWFYISYRNFF